LFSQELTFRRYKIMSFSQPYLPLKNFALRNYTHGLHAVQVTITVLFMSVLTACGGGGGVASTSPAATGTTSASTNPSATPAGAPTTSVPSGVESITVSAGPNKTMTLPESRIDLQGSAPGVSATWSQVSGPAAAVFKSTSTPQTMVMADQAGTYVMRLTARDAAGGTKSSDVTLTVNPNTVVIGTASTPLDHLQSIARPAFKQGHTLLPLSKSTCGIWGDINIELMKYWGYSALFNYPDGPVAEEVKANPGRYPIEVALGNLYTIYDNFAVLPAEAYLRDASGTFILNGGRRIPSPAAPDAVVNIVADIVGKQVAFVETTLNQPIKLVQNSGEYGVWLLGDDGPKFYEKDPTVVAAYNASGLDWNAYNSREKARHEKLIKDGIINKLKKGRPIYFAYGEAYGNERGRWFGWRNFIFLWEKFIGADGKPAVSDYSSPEMYYNFHNSGWSGINGNSMVPWDALTQALKNIGGTIKLGQRNVYPWVSLGWDGGDSGGISDNDMFMGMMKSYYTLGALGAASGYFTCDGAPFQAMRLNQPVGTTVPTQIRGLYLLGQTHALFSHLEEYLREGDLLPGVGTHPYTDYGQEITPSMEFPAIGETAQQTGTFGPITIPTARVLARKIKNQDRWLISAWANTGVDREVRVTIDPKLGEMKLNARRAGSIYLAEIKNGVISLRLVDEDGMKPTRTLFP
jgi:hypothetical protein